ncbi:MAG: chromate transporter [Bacteroidales bacterium]|nr:chromate transporter [Bacteroidales bacterium]
MVKYCDLFKIFMKIGTFTIGGGYAMIPLMQREIVEKEGWLSQQDFLDLLAVSQAMPGVFAGNMACAVGYRLKGKRGALCAVAGNVAAPFAIILLLAMFFRFFRGNVAIERIFMGLRPCVAALIAAPVFNMACTAGITWRNAWIPIAAAGLIWLLGVSPILIVLAAGLLGYLYGKVVQRRPSQTTVRKKRP